MTTPFKFIVQSDKTIAINAFRLPTDLSLSRAMEVLVSCDIKAGLSSGEGFVRFADHAWTGATDEDSDGYTCPANPEKSATITKLRHDIVYVLQAYSCIDWEYVLDESFVSDTNSRDMPLRRVIDKEMFYNRDRYRNWTAMVRDWLQGLPSAMGGMMFATYEIETWQAALGIEVGDDAYWDGMARAVGRIAKGVKREV